MMNWMDITSQTGPFLHGAHRVAHLSFRSDGVPRSFTVVMASAYVDGEMDFDRNGIAVIDNDNRTVVLDEHLKGDMASQSRFLSGVMHMTWSDFCDFVSENPRYRGNVSDLGDERPFSGNPGFQIQSGATLLPKTADDIRSPSLISAANDPECPYNFQPISAADARSWLKSHHFSCDGLDMMRFAWQLDISPELFDKGKVQGNSAADFGWSDHYRRVPELKHEILDEIQKPIMAMQFTAWPGGQEGRYSFMSLPSGDVGLDAIDGEPLLFHSLDHMVSVIDDMDHITLREIWIAVHCADHDMSPIVLEKAFSACLKEERLQFELNCGMTRKPRLPIEHDINI